MKTLSNIQYFIVIICLLLTACNNDEDVSEPSCRLLSTSFTTYTYNTNNQLIRITFSDGDINSLKYNDSGQLISKVFNSNGFQEYIWEDNRLVSSTLRNSLDEITTYSYVYNTNNQLIQRNIEWDSGVKATNTYTYDNNGNLIKNEYHTLGVERRIVEYSNFDDKRNISSSTIFRNAFPNEPISVNNPLKSVLTLTDDSGNFRYSMTTIVSDATYNEQGYLISFTTTEKYEGQEDIVKVRGPYTYNCN